MTQPLDVLALAAHPDDVELCAGGTMCLLHDQGYTTGVVDFTRGELGSRGTPETRAQEAEVASGVLGLSARHNLALPDGDIPNTAEAREALIQRIRLHRPSIVLINAPEDRHPDHPAASRLATDALFYSGLVRIETEWEGEAQEPWRPPHVLHYMQSIPFEPTFVIDVSSVWERRMEALLSYRTQFYTGGDAAESDASEASGETSGESEPETFISNPAFLQWVEARARTYGYRVGATYGEPFLYRHGPVGVTDLVAMLSREPRFR
ncbi:bacillithiol biosynthesis deacetylase BshB1 [Rubricoccus marinus]|uniref:Bacillithiol biosynthesis deacetylase BshB1 n=1 Tax=Rubricoccus marinus TaxID=716817 RepID=A0A259U0X9_9BACT|nr:bacillithiol biosynthesis deacetylase BshB1 [Rubricoccus marinus]OZC03498.1 bacillithiol biosynthesis deacetylase BshB1 [Rubricoccus marinus]